VVNGAVQVITGVLFVVNTRVTLDAGIDAGALPHFRMERMSEKCRVVTFNMWIEDSVFIDVRVAWEP
jgi:hypothetical protein